MSSSSQKKREKEKSNNVNVENKPLNPKEENKSNSESNPPKKTSQFLEAMRIYYRAPIVKFYIHLYSYILFLIIFCYLNLVELKPISEIRRTKQKISAEIFVYIYSVTFIIEEIRQVCEQTTTGLHNKIKAYFALLWNIFDVVIILLFIISIITRFTIEDHHFMICRCLFSITLSIFFLRSMQFYFVNKYIGPKVIMIIKMLRDILFFLSIFVLFLMAYGTLAHTLRYPNSILNFKLIKDVVHMPYFQTYGELMLDDLKAPNTCNGTDCIIKETVVMFSFGAFLLLTNILLINLLIAMFGYTFNQIQKKSEKLWCYLRLQLVLEFYKKPILPPPLNILFHIYEIFKCCKRPCTKKPCGNEKNLLLKKLNKDQSFKSRMFEKKFMESVMCKLPNTDKSKYENWNTPQDNTTGLDEKPNLKYETSALNNLVESIASYQVRNDRRLDHLESLIDTLKAKSNT